MEEEHSINVIEVTKLIDMNKQILEKENEVESNGDNVLPEVTDPIPLWKKLQLFNMNLMWDEHGYQKNRTVLEPYRYRLVPVPVIVTRYRLSLPGMVPVP
ncbi:hypothetical protein Tco_1125642 [Tanacetum coccineum]|uniref:Uncharacterized protein n=1 Tax=Tanacetum coccineum TaxID=301880 RepID=A0ABQ5JCD6_9ASTR